MPNPVRLGGSWYLRVNTPRDLRDRVMGTRISLPVDGLPRTLTVQEAVKLSLRTQDQEEAKRRFAIAYGALEDHWANVRSGPKPLSHKNSLAIAGAIRAEMVEVTDDNPDGLLSQVLLTLLQGASEAPHGGAAVQDPAVQEALEALVGGVVDGFLTSRGLLVADTSRPQLLLNTAKALHEAAQVAYAKSQGDYSDDGTTARYPALDVAQVKGEGETGPQKVTFGAILDRWVEDRARGKDPKPLPPRTERKYRQASQEFAQFRGSDIVETVTARQARDWMESLLEEERLSNNTIKQRLQNVRTVIDRGRRQNIGELFTHSNPLELVELPTYASVPSQERTLRLDEAQKILVRARQEQKPDLRWLPWLCAYSGARINELAQLSPDSFFQVEGSWFFKITSMGGRTLKTAGSERRVPVHPDLIAEGLMGFVDKVRAIDPAQRLFPKRADCNLRDWVRGPLGLTRKELSPNHGWRHLFEDVATVAQMTDRARNYITGRAERGSDGGYGYSEAMLPGLAEQMAKVRSYLDG